MTLKIVAAAIQMASTSGDMPGNLAAIDDQLSRAHADGASIAVLPEMVNTGYGLIPDYGPFAETLDGPTLSHLRSRSRQWGMMIACGFVERDGHHLYDSLALCLPDGRQFVYRKRNLVFWERFRFRPGRESPVVETPFGRVGMAICADMIYRRVWDGYRGRIDLAIVSAAWPEFSCRETGRKHWLFGHIGPMASAIPGQVAKDLGVPVVFANQVGETRTTIPYLGTWITDKITDRFAGGSCVADGLHAAPVLAGTGSETVLSEITLHPSRGPRSWRSMSPSGFAASSSGSAAAGSASRRTGSIAARVAAAP
jgi:predicted amidohydrolase